MKLEVEGRKVRLEAQTQEEVEQLREIWKRVGKRKGMLLYPRYLSTTHASDRVPPLKPIEQYIPRVKHDPRVRFPLECEGSLVLEIGRRDRKNW